MQRRHLAFPLAMLGWAVLTAFFWILVYNVSVRVLFDVRATIFGHANGAIVTALLLWALVDAVFPRRAIFGRMGLIDGPQQRSVQFLGLITIVGLTLLGLLAALRIPMIENDGGEQAYWSLVGGIASAGVGALGWSLSNLQQQTLKRVTDTEQAIRDILQDYENRIIKRAATHIYRNVTRKGAGSEEVPFDAVEGNFLRTFGKVATFSNNPSGLSESIYFDVPSRYFVYEYLNILERVALGVRLGHYDFNYTYNALHEIVLNSYGRWRQFVSKERDGKHYKTMQAQGVACSILKTKMVYENLVWLVWHFSWKKNAKEFNKIFLRDVVVMTDGMLPLVYVGGKRQADSVEA